MKTKGPLGLLLAGVALVAAIGAGLGVAGSTTTDIALPPGTAPMIVTQCSAPTLTPVAKNPQHHSLACTDGSTTTTTTPTTGGNCTAPVVTETGAHDTYSVDGTGQTWWASNDDWNGSAGPQSLQVCSASSWNAIATQTDHMGEVESYPDTELDVGGRGPTGVPNSTKPLSAYSSITSTFSEAFPASGWAGDAGYDLWLNNWRSETMIWNDVRGTQTFWSNCAEPGPDFNTCGLAQPPVAVTLGGVAYHFFSYGAQGSNAERVFVRDVPVTSGTVDILAAYNWEVANGWASATDVPTQLEYGPEIAATTGTQTFPLTNLTFDLP